jgi:hypothetical protein
LIFGVAWIDRTIDMLSNEIFRCSKVSFKEKYISSSFIFRWGYHHANFSLLLLMIASLDDMGWLASLLVVGSQQQAKIIEILNERLY